MREAFKAIAVDAKERRPPFPFDAYAIRCISHCILCGQPATARIAKTGKPFMSCGSCMSRIFLNSEKAAREFLKSRIAKGESNSAYVKMVAISYHRLADAKNPEDVRQKSFKWAGPRCTICRGLSELRFDKKNRPYQRCFWRGSFTFLHTRVGEAGLITRASLRPEFR